MNPRRLALLFLVLAAGAAAVFAVRQTAGDGDEATEEGDAACFTVARGELLVPIVESGNLQAQRSTRIHSELDREVKIVYLVDEGARVKKGDVLVRFDTTDIDREIETETQAVEAAEASYEAARVDLEIQKTDWKNELAEAALAVEEAEKALEKYQKGELPLQERENQVRVEEAETNLARAREKLAQMPRLLEEGFVTQDRVEQEKIAVKKAEVAYETAKSDKELFETYTRPLELQKKKAAIERARTQLEATRKRVEARSRQKETELATSKVSLDNRKAKLADLEQQRKKTTILAPTDGLVVYGERDRWGRGTEVQVGAQVYRHTTILNLPDLSRMEVKLRVHEMDIDHVRAGMPVTVTVEAAGSVSYPGRVTRTAELATEAGWRSDPEVKQFDVEVTLDGEDLGLKPGTTAKVEIVLQHRTDVLFVPIRAVRAVGEELFCYVRGPEGLERRVVTVGVSNDKFVEILSGLSEGEKVLVGLPPQPLLDAEEERRESEGAEKEAAAP